MAYTGSNQKSTKHGRTPNADWTEVPDVPYAGPWPDLPKLPGRQKWHEMVLRWWDVVKVLPHCVLWDDADWLYAIETAFMKHYYFRDVANDEGTTSAATEIRRREDTIGTTMEARRKLHIRYVDVEAEGVQVAVGVGVESDSDEPAKVIQQSGPAAVGVPSLADRRARLTGKSKTA